MSAYDCIISVSSLTVTFEKRSGRQPLSIPLHSLEDGPEPGIDLFEGGVVWEDEPAVLSFRVESSAWVRKATITINDHNELWMNCDWLPESSYGGVRTYGYDFVSGGTNMGDEYRLPFSLTCGFARICVHLYMHDGSTCAFETPDIVCLDEPRSSGDGQHGERAEESNVRSMYQTLLGQEASFADRQASEWMFAPPAQEGERLSADEDTEWARLGLVRLLRAGDCVLDLVYDGFEDEGDGFPNETSGPAAHTSYDTDENQQVRALLTSLSNRASEVAVSVSEGVALLEELHQRVTSIVKQQEALRGKKQSLPALELIGDQLDQERSWLVRAVDLAERARDTLAEFDSFVGGKDCVTQVAFALPSRAGLYAAGGRYEQLYEAMVTWDAVRELDVERADETFYALKPDRLFEYFALQHMLAGLYDLGFRENERVAQPIARYTYRLAETYGKYQNEMRCANTYHLARELASGGRQEVDLYYQPVIYEEGPRENGICLRRRSTDRSSDVARVWTPDYLLTVRMGKGVRWYAIDAKYRKHASLTNLRGVLSTCVDKYLIQTRVVNEGEREGLVNGIWILSGRLPEPASKSAKDTPAHPRLLWSAVRDGLAPSGKLPSGVDVPCGIFAWNRNTGSRKVRVFFHQLGIVREG